MLNLMWLERLFDHSPEVLTAVASIAIAMFTGTLWYSTRTKTPLVVVRTKDAARYDSQHGSQTASLMVGAVFCSPANNLSYSSICAVRRCTEPAPSPGGLKVRAEYKGVSG
jgi:hypothetical protein